ncbi:RBBP9/YdeN family alpha/beta hydrolase [Arthrobacter sp. NPDC090010]|uniref:RBBP9/YdeN family alpha/beta hydrolase n=1 Tax=Arthrobacter sp. NPDC090010 TaxID=3363942 RepID=UPI0037F942E5
MTSTDLTSTTTARRALIFHGYGATPEDHWFRWLADRLERDGIPATVPSLPDPSAPDRESWDNAARAALGSPDSGTLVVAHSLGCLTVLRALRSLKGPWRLGTLVLVAGFVDPLPALPGLDAFIDGGVELDGLAQRIDSLTVLRSDADAFVPTEHTDRLAGLLGTSADVVPGAGHFLADDGVTSLPAAYEALGSWRG